MADIQNDIATESPLRTEAGELDDEGVDEGAAVDAAGRTRERSSVKFPYFDLEDVTKVAYTLHHKRGGQCEAHELAAELRQKPKSGSFRLRLSAARMYGLIALERGAGRLTAR